MGTSEVDFTQATSIRWNPLIIGFIMTVFVSIISVDSWPVKKRVTHNGKAEVAGIIESVKNSGTPPPVEDWKHLVKDTVKDIFGSTNPQADRDQFNNRGKR